MPTLIASAKAPIVYLNIPKSGCTSFKNWFYWLDYGKLPDNPISIHETQAENFVVNDDERFKERLGDFTFTFVRHPIRRAYATFNDKIAHHQGGAYFKPAQAFFAKNYGVKFRFPWYWRGRRGSVFWYRRSFLKFLQFVEDTKTGKVDFRYDWHWAEQTYLLEESASVRAPDFVGKLENLANDFPPIAARAGVSADTLPHVNEGSRIAPSYDQVVNDRILEMGAKVYANDFAQLGYTVR
jgi:hypothetical protein